MQIAARNGRSAPPVPVCALLVVRVFQEHVPKVSGATLPCPARCLSTTRSQGQRRAHDELSPGNPSPSSSAATWSNRAQGEPRSGPSDRSSRQVARPTSCAPPERRGRQTGVPGSPPARAPRCPCGATATAFRLRHRRRAGSWSTSAGWRGWRSIDAQPSPSADRRGHQLGASRGRALLPHGLAISSGEHQECRRRWPDICPAATASKVRTSMALALDNIVAAGDCALPPRRSCRRAPSGTVPSCSGRLWSAVGDFGIVTTFEFVARPTDERLLRARIVSLLRRPPACFRVGPRTFARRRRASPSLLIVADPMAGGPRHQSRSTSSSRAMTRSWPPRRSTRSVGWNGARRRRGPDPVCGRRSVDGATLPPGLRWSLEECVQVDKESSARRPPDPGRGRDLSRRGTAPIIGVPF